MINYTSTPVLWISLVAARKGHWLLAIVALGTLTSEVLQVGMSALWTSEPSTIVRNIKLAQTLELRSVSHNFRASGDSNSQEGGSDILFAGV
jgi:hypothetical protein